jgi:hypothetical protein
MTDDAKKLTSAYLDDAFLGRVKRSYKLAIKGAGVSHESMWAQIGKMQLTVHEALMKNDNTDLIGNPCDLRRTKRNSGDTSQVILVSVFCLDGVTASRGV